MICAMIYFYKFLSLSERFFRREKVGDLISRMINDMQSLRATAALGFLHVINTIMIFSFVCYQMFKINVSLTFFMLIPIPIMLVLVRFFVKELYVASKANQEALGQMTDFFVEVLSGIKLIKSYVAETKMNQSFDKKNSEFFHPKFTISAYSNHYFSICCYWWEHGTNFLLWIGGELIMKQQLTIGDFVALTVYIGLLSWPTASLLLLIYCNEARFLGNVFHLF